MGLLAHVYFVEFGGRKVLGVVLSYLRVGKNCMFFLCDLVKPGSSK